ncbi:MAG: SGNH/GDSL hydrolase family protein [Ruminococcaceae bacterium]|nr:SGNH/GDSL hydrolase family protein [Oscillospiraceae bacterium]
MKKIIALILLCCLICSACPVLARDTTKISPKSYGVDNLNNEKGNLYVAFLGGSITAGAGSSGNIQYKDGAGSGNARWSSQITKRYFQKKYPNKNVIEVNAGIGGTDSNLGLFRMKDQLIDQCGTEGPDVVFVEFAVNDMWVSNSRPHEIHQRMEGIVRQLSALPKQPVIIFVYTAAWKEDTGFEMYQTSAKVHQQVADYYNIGSINLCDYVAGGTDIDGNAIIWNPSDSNSWTGDLTHPNDKGYTGYADYILKQFNEKPEQYFRKLTWNDIPMSNYEFGSPQLVPVINNENVTTTGTWNQDMKLVSWWFKDGVMKTTQAASTMTFQFTGRSIGIFSIFGNTASNAAYVIDRGSANPISGQLEPYNATINSKMPAPSLLRNDLSMGEHTIEIVTYSANKGAEDGFVVGYFMVDPEQPDPIVSNVKLSEQDNVAYGTELEALYSYLNGEKEEGNSIIQWLVSDSKNGSYTPIKGKEGATYTPGFDMVGKYVKCRVTPVDLLGNQGKSADSNPVLVCLPPVGECFYTTGIAYLSEDEDTVAKTYITNILQDASLKVSMIMAEYEVDEQGTKKMIQQKTVTREIASGETMKLENQMKISNSSDRLVKTMIWTEPGLEPISATAQVKGGKIEQVTYLNTDTDENETNMFVYRVNWIDPKE